MKKAYKMNNGAPYVIMVLPALLVFVTFFILPLIFTAKYSFYSWTNFSQEITFNGLENYRKIFDDPILAKGIKKAGRILAFPGKWLVKSMKKRRKRLKFHGKNGKM